MNKPQIREDIQGLRGVAVVSVILFHLNGLLPGGFIGVDIFFVISGFVITKSIYESWRQNGKFNLVPFYSRRVKRLLPALSVMITVISTLIFFLFSPLGMQQNSSKTAIGSLLLAANYVTAKVTSNYFSLPAATNPFLHTWSLSVEEQFYLIFPLFFIILGFTTSFRLRGRVLFHSIFTISLISFCLMISGPIPGWLSGFYSPITRAWEFGVGILSFLFSKNIGMKFRSNTYLEALRAISLGALVFSLLEFNPNSGYPSVKLLLPVLATGCLLAYGASQRINTVLSSRPSTYIGDRSYSLYLWHWPFIVLSNYLFPENELALYAFLGLGIVFAIVAYRFFENPIRKKQNMSFRHISMMTIVFLLVPLIAASTVGYVAKKVYFPRFETGAIQGNFEGDIGAIGFEAFVNAHTSQCRNQAENPSVRECEADIAVLGDSHAEHLVPGFVKNYPKLVVIDLGNLILDSVHGPEEENLKSQLLGNGYLSVVVINKYWAHSGIPSGLAKTVTDITKSGKRVILLDDAPNFPFDAFTCKYGKSIFIHSGNCEMTKDRFAHELSTYQPQLLEISKKNEMVSLFKSSAIFCGLESCSMVKNGVLNYLDLNHLNANGSSLVTARMVKQVSIFCDLLSSKLDRACNRV